MPYEAKADVPLLPGERIDEKSPLYVAFAADAEKRGMSQRDFSAQLSEYVRRSRASAPAPAPAPARPFSSLTTAEKFAAGLNNPPKRG